MKAKSVVDIYQEILSGDKNKFPKGTWSPSNGGYDNFRRCFSYLIYEKLGWNRQEVILNVTDKFMQNYRLYGAMEVLFKYQLYAAINYTFPEWNIKVWEMPVVPKGTWENKDNIIEAIRWLFIEKLKWNREEMLGASLKLLEENGFASIKDNLKSGENTIFDILNISFPEYQFQKHEFNNIKNWTKEEIRESVKWFIEDEVKCKNKQDVLERLYFKTFVDHGYVKFLAFFDNSLFNLLSFVYPEQDWEEIKDRPPKDMAVQLARMLEIRHGKNLNKT